MQINGAVRRAAPDKRMPSCVGLRIKVTPALPDLFSARYAERGRRYQPSRVQIDNAVRCAMPQRCMSAAECITVTYLERTRDTCCSRVEKASWMKIDSARRRSAPKQRVIISVGWS